MAKINIRESLGRIDLLTDNKYDLRNTYDSSNISNDKKKKLAESLSNSASAKQIYNILNEDTIKQNGKWVNKGSEGTHGKFKTKKAADAQRKAMFANGYKGESLEEDVEDDFDSDEYEREHILRLAKAVKEASKGADERKLSNLKKTAKKYLTNHKGTKHEKEYAVLQKAYDSLLDEDWEPDEWEETDFLDNDGKKVYINIIKEAEDIDDLKDIAHDLYWHDKGLFAMLRNFPKDKSFEWIQNRMIEVIESTMNESLTEASYGGAYDIEDDMFWTKDDLIEFSDAVCEKLADKFGYQYDIADVGAESNNDMYITIMDTTHDIEADVSFRIKMSRIRAPRDLMKYLDTVVSEFVKKFEEEYQYYDFDESLNEDVDDEEIDLDVETDFGDGSVEEGDTFIEDGRTWSWIERIAGPIHLDFDNWAVWSARDWDYIQEKIRPILLNKEELTVETLTKIYDEAEVAYFVVDEDTGFIDWGPVESQTEAQDFLNGKVEDWENDDEYDESLKESKQLKESYGLELEYDDIDGDGSSYTYEVDEDKVLDYLRDRDDYPEEIGNLPDDEFQAWFKTKEYDEWLEDNLYELFEKHYDDLLDYFEEDAQTEFFNMYGDEYSQDWETGSWYRRRW